MEVDSDSITKTYDNVIMSVGATVVLSLILFLSWVTEFLPDGVLLSIGLFFSLPLFFTFIFGIIYNRPNFSDRRRYGFLAYWVVALGFFYFFLPPVSVTNTFMLFLQFLVGFLISIISGILYIVPFNLMKKYSYRINAAISFLISFGLTYIILFALKYWSFFQLLE